MQIIYHIDMNAFFANCEIKHHPEYKGKPLIVAHKSRRGIVSTASYEARKFGIHSAMPTYLAVEKCPDVIIAEPNYKLYSDTSKAFFEIVKRYSEKIQIASIDECYVDMSEACFKHGGILETAIEMQRVIYDELQIPCSIGISPNRFLSKMASDIKKPMGITVITRKNIKKVLWPIDISDMYGIGKKTAPRLKNLGINTIGDLADYKNFSKVKSILGRNALIYYQHANGLDFSKLDLEDHDSKSVGHSTTFLMDTSDENQIQDTLKKLTESVCERAKRHHLVGNNISITLKYTLTESIVRSTMMEEYTNDYEMMIAYVFMLLEKHYNGEMIRLVGVSLNNTIHESRRVKQLSLFNYQEELLKNKTDDSNS